MQIPGIQSIQLHDVHKSFDRQAALSGVSSTFRQGEISLVMGENGAGKSTLLSILATLSRPTSGQVLYDQLPHRRAERELRGRIALVAHAPMLYSQMSSRENLMFFAEIHGISGARELVSGWLERVGMALAADRPVLQLSRGMVQRISLARALLCAPWLLLLDEPFTGLDREGVALLRRELGQARDAGVLVLIVSHDVEALDGMVDHLLLLRRGRTDADLREPAMNAARMLELYHAPR